MSPQGVILRKTMKRPFFLSIALPKGFTLIELVITVTILAILAAVAIPFFGNMQKQARDNATKDIVGVMREAIQLYRVNEIISGRQVGTAGNWPQSGCPGTELHGIEQRAGSPWVMENGIVPDNPWARGVVTAGRENWIQVESVSIPQGELSVVADTGWRYNRVTCQIWANTAVNGGPITENEF